MIRAASAFGQRECAVLRQASVNTSDVVLSVAISNYNNAKYVTAAVRSALLQTFPQLEVIVIDDGSTDDSLEQLGRISDPRVSIIAQKNRGLAGARNTGILFSRGRYIGFLDADDLWHVRKAERHLALMAVDPSIGLTFSYSAYLDEDGVPTGQLLISRSKQPSARDLAFRNHVGNGSTPIIRRECFEQAGLFAEDLRSCEDYEMWVRIAALTPYKVRLVPEVLTGYRVRSGSLTMSFEPFIQEGRKVVDRFTQYLPSFSRRDADRCYAEVIRIASRKALSNGEMVLSRRLLLEALRYCPTLMLRDPRAFGLFVIHGLSVALPKRFEMSAYRAARALMKQFYSLFAVSHRHVGDCVGGWEQ
jgi:glycosyltransferase involved in cell wall biosynthesis